MTEPDERSTEILGWALDHCAIEANLDAAFVVVGDPEVLWSGPLLTVDHLDGRPWAVIELPAGKVLGVAGRVSEDGPWLFVTTTSDGPLDSVTVQPSIWTDEGASSVDVSVTIRSGRLVAGEPSTVRAWGPTVDVDHGGVAQSRTGFDEPEQVYVGLVVVVRIPEGECPVEVAVTADGRLHALRLKPPRPDWTPPVLRPVSS